VPDDAPWIEPVVVPDDLRELQGEVDAYHREQKLAGRRRWLHRLAGSPAWRRTALPLAVVSSALALAGVVFTVLTVGMQQPTTAPVPAPTATAPAAAVGERFGLLPDVTVATLGAPMKIVELRPALVALVPLHCDCKPVLASLAGQAAEVAVPFVVVAPAAQDAEVAALAGQLHHGDVVPVFDADATLAGTYDASGVTVLAVAPDGTVDYLDRDVVPSDRFELYLQQMVA
jgi:hypothetical protein